jgi:NUDIX domain
MPGRIDGFLRHVASCRSAAPRRTRLPFLVDGKQVGWIDRAVLDIVAAQGARLSETAVSATADRLQPMARALVDAGRCRWRNENFDVRACADRRVVGVMDRGALPIFGIEAWGVHINGLVQRGEEPWLWVARRGADRPLDPGKLDHVVAGGIPAGLDAAQTLVKEAGEEACVPPELAGQASFMTEIPYCVERPEGLRRDRLFCYDLTLPDSFTPRPGDTEVAGFELWPLSRVFETVRDTDAFKFNVSLVLIDLFIRHGLLDRTAFAVLYDEPEGMTG